MFTRRRSRGFLLDTVNRGAEFVETLKTVYPMADALHEKDFDWLFDCPETEQFLEWFCNTVGEENVLSPGEVEAYQTLLSSGKPILEGEALQQVLQTCRQCPQLKGAMSEDEALPLEALEREAQALHSHSACQLRRRNKLQIRAASLKQELCHLADKERKVGRVLRKAQLDLERENSQTNSVLSQVCKAANQLAEWYREAGNGRLLVLMSEADLGHYMELEELATRALVAFIQKALCQEMVKGLAEAAHIILLEIMGGPEVNILESLGSYQEELKRMTLAYICSQKELITTSAEVDGIRAGLQWAERALKSSKENKQLCALQSDIDQTQTQHLVPLLQATAHLLHLPVLRAELDREAVHLGYTTLKQEEVAGQLMAQHSRLELLGLQLKLEKKEQQQVGTCLEKMVAALQEASANLQGRLACFEDSSLYTKICPRTLIDPSDVTTIRLWEMLEKQGQEKQLFRTYETLASRGSRLRQEQRMLEVQLAVSPAQLPMLESDDEMLYKMMYSDSNQLLLNAQELAEPMEQLCATQAKLYQMLMDLLSDLKAKRKSLQTHFQQTERNLYVHFFRDANQLREVVQQLEKQALAFS
uniref:HAUS augmin-like complex subunit 3 N-terminal domain-containing protein n=1 Tax=Gopherus evgoodei TaxID=1825980 RepID=A0A8C4W5D8_9SAUR